MNRCIIFDCETATLPKMKELERTGEIPSASFRFPLIYDAGWTICDLDTGEILKKFSSIVLETYYNESVFSTAYYRNKRQTYDEMIERGEIKQLRWEQIAKELEKDLQTVNYVSAYNASFDYRAIQKTEKYIQRRKEGTLNQYEKWLIDFYLSNSQKNLPPRKTNTECFIFRDYQKPIVDIWAMACEYLAQDDGYKDFCIDNDLTEGRTYFPTGAETVYKYLATLPDFEERHMALNDAEIETDILLETLAGCPLIIGITYFPFRKVGKIRDYR